uniref:Uncharacterized protein n=1 Tax=Glossina brevipalpis TaxID=37001 RepID=A0A1A9W1L7_9MUSC
MHSSPFTDSIILFQHDIPSRMNETKILEIVLMTKSTISDNDSVTVQLVFLSMYLLSVVICLVNVEKLETSALCQNTTNTGFINLFNYNLKVANKHNARKEKRERKNKLPVEC